MADITLCTGEGCPKRAECYRFKATPNQYWQSYFMKPPVKADGECESFWLDERTPEDGRGKSDDNGR